VRLFQGRDLEGGPPLLQDQVALDDGDAGEEAGEANELGVVTVSPSSQPQRSAPAGST